MSNYFFIFKKILYFPSKNFKKIFEKNIFENFNKSTIYMIITSEVAKVL